MRELSMTDRTTLTPENDPKALLISPLHRVVDVDMRVRAS